MPTISSSLAEFGKAFTFAKNQSKPNIYFFISLVNSKKMKIPLYHRLRRKAHVDIALLQDEVVDILYSILKTPVLHGGTVIWRCLGGNRFSEDLDFYAVAIPENFEKLLADELKTRALSLIKYKRTKAVVFAKISDGRNEIRLEIALRKPKRKIIQRYEKADGTYSDIYVLPLEELAKEKMAAYLSRMSIRDFYDLYFLSGLIDTTAIANEALLFLKKAERVAPKDEKTLKALIFTGIAPSFGEMLAALKNRFKMKK